MSNQTDVQTRANASDGDRPGQYVTLQQFNALRERVDAIALKDDGMMYLAVNSTGPASQANGIESVAIASGAEVDSEECVAVGYLAGTISADYPGSVYVGAYAQGYALSATAMGYYTFTNAYGAVAAGCLATVSASGNKGIAIGDLALVDSDSALAIGANATVHGAQSVALGCASTTDRAQTVSVGNDSTRRFIARVAAGQEDDDAATVGQLKEAGLSVTARGEVESALVLYDDRSKTRLTLQSVKVAGLRPAEQSLQSTDAVAGSQLFKANQQLVELEARLAALERAVRQR